MTAELADESFHDIIKITTVRGRAGSQFVRRQVATSCEMLHSGDDTEAGTSNGQRQAIRRDGRGSE